MNKITGIKIFYFGDQANVTISRNSKSRTYYSTSRKNIQKLYKIINSLGEKVKFIFESNYYIIGE
jgi:hypothetical protein